MRHRKLSKTCIAKILTGRADAAKRHRACASNFFVALVASLETLDFGILIAATEAAATATSGCLACHGDSAAAQLQVLPLVPGPSAAATLTRGLGWPGQRVALAARAPSERGGGAAPGVGRGHGITPAGHSVAP